MARRIACWLLAAALVGTGIWMMLNPPSFYATVPGVAETGPLNLHFVRDIGAAYATAGIAVAWAALAPAWGAPLATMAACFLSLHALIHGIERVAGLHGSHTLVPELASVWLLAACSVALALWFRARPGRA